MSAKHFINPYFKFFIILISFATLLPLPYAISQIFHSGFLLEDYLIKPLLGSFSTGIILVIVTCLFCMIWAFPAAFLLSFYHFRFKKFLVASLVLPIAVPSYLSAYVYSDLFYYTGDIAQYYRQLTGELLPFNIRSVVGAGFVLSLSLYPYLFFPLYVRLQYFPTSMIDYARTTGKKKITILRRSLLPLVMPLIIYSLALIALETLSDYGTVSYYGIDTPAIFLFDIWSQTADITLSFKITFIFLILTCCIFYGAYFFQKNKSFSLPRASRHATLFYFHTRLIQLVAMSFFVFIVLISLCVPVFYFLFHLIITPQQETYSKLFALTVNSLTPAIIATSLCIIVSLVLSYYMHHERKGHILKIIIQIATTGYAFPSVILAVAIYSGLNAFDKSLSFYLFDMRYSIISGTTLGLILCYYTKFLTVSYGSIAPTYKTISPSLYEASLLTGRGNFLSAKLVYFPLFKRPIITAGILVFADILKELPATLLLRPFGFDSFATHTYDMAGLERVTEASGSALILIIVGLAVALIPIKYQIFQKKD